MQRSKRLLGAALGVVFAAMANAAMAQDEIKIGEINSYSLLPAFTEPYRKGWQLAVEEINAAGGVNGKKLVVISKDDGGKPADALTAANELVSSDNVAMLAEPSCPILGSPSAISPSRRRSSSWRPSR